MAGLPLSRRSTKDLIKSYNEALDAYVASTVLEPLEELLDEPVTEVQDVDDDGKEDKGSSGQMKLF